jgi:hypothetical protein
MVNRSTELFISIDNKESSKEMQKSWEDIKVFVICARINEE